MIEQGPHAQCDPLIQTEPRISCELVDFQGDEAILEATADSYRTEQEEKYDAAQQLAAEAQATQLAAAREQTTKAMQRLFGPNGEANLVPQLMVNLLRKPVFQLPGNTRAEYFDVLSHVMDTNPDLVQQVKAICITRNCDAKYEENIYLFETVVAEFIQSCASLQSLTLNQFHAREVIRMLPTLKSQKNLRYLNLCDNSLEKRHLGIVVRCLPPSKQLTLELDGNNLSDDHVAGMFARRSHVTLQHRAQKDSIMHERDRC